MATPATHRCAAPAGASDATPGILGQMLLLLHGLDLGPDGVSGQAHESLFICLLPALARQTDLRIQRQPILSLKQCD